MCIYIYIYIHMYTAPGRAYLGGVCVCVLLMYCCMNSECQIRIICTSLRPIPLLTLRVSGGLTQAQS